MTLRLCLFAACPLSLLGFIGDRPDFVGLIGSEAVDFFRPLGGDDTIEGVGGRDWIWYIDSTIAINLNLENQSITAAGGSRDTFASIEAVACSQAGDTTIGSTGDDDISSYQGDDTLDGGAGFDTATWPRTQAWRTASTRTFL